MSARPASVSRAARSGDWARGLRASATARPRGAPSMAPRGAARRSKCGCRRGRLRPIQLAPTAAARRTRASRAHIPNRGRGDRHQLHAKRVNRCRARSGGGAYLPRYAARAGPLAEEIAACGFEPGAPGSAGRGEGSPRRPWGGSSDRASDDLGEQFPSPRSSRPVTASGCLIGAEADDQARRTGVGIASWRGVMANSSRARAAKSPLLRILRLAGRTIWSRTRRIAACAAGGEGLGACSAAGAGDERKGR